MGTSSVNTLSPFRHPGRVRTRGLSCEHKLCLSLPVGHWAVFNISVILVNQLLPDLLSITIVFITYI